MYITQSGKDNLTEPKFHSASGVLRSQSPAAYIDYPKNPFFSGDVGGRCGNAENQKTESLSGLRKPSTLNGQQSHHAFVATGADTATKNQLSRRHLIHRLLAEKGKRTPNMKMALAKRKI